MESLRNTAGLKDKSSDFSHGREALHDLACTNHFHFIFHSSGALNLITSHHTCQPQRSRTCSCSKAVLFHSQASFMGAISLGISLALHSVKSHSFSKTSCSAALCDTVRDLVQTTDLLFLVPGTFFVMAPHHLMLSGLFTNLLAEGPHSQRPLSYLPLYSLSTSHGTETAKQVKQLDLLYFDQGDWGSQVVEGV